jgi:hypothetical protein
VERRHGRRMVIFLWMTNRGGGADLKGSGRHLLRYPEFTLRDWGIPRKLPVSGAGFGSWMKTGTSLMHSGSTNYCRATLVTCCCSGIDYSCSCFMYLCNEIHNTCPIRLSDEQITALNVIHVQLTVSVRSRTWGERHSHRPRGVAGRGTLSLSLSLEYPAASTAVFRWD